eukprot:2814850-Rhodomonas_salina.1
MGVGLVGGQFQASDDEMAKEMLIGRNPVGEVVSLDVWYWRDGPSLVRCYGRGVKDCKDCGVVVGGEGFGVDHAVDQDDLRQILSTIDTAEEGVTYDKFRDFLMEVPGSVSPHPSATRATTYSVLEDSCFAALDADTCAHGAFPPSHSQHSASSPSSFVFCSSRVRTPTAP